MIDKVRFWTYTTTDLKKNIIVSALKIITNGGNDNRYKYKNIEITINDTSTYFSGSLTKLVSSNGNNYTNENILSILYGIKELKDIFDLPLNNCFYSYFEYGINLEMTKPAIHYISAIKELQNFTETYSHTNGTIRFKKSTDKYYTEITAYDKTKQVKDTNRLNTDISDLPDNLLRFELRLSKNIKQQLKINNLYETFKIYKNVICLFEKYFKKIIWSGKRMQLLNTKITKTKLKDFSLYSHFKQFNSFEDYIENLKNNGNNITDKTKHDLKDLYNKLMKEYVDNETTDVKAEVADNINNILTDEKDNITLLETEYDTTRILGEL